MVYIKDNPKKLFPIFATRSPNTYFAPKQMKVVHLQMTPLFLNIHLLGYSIEHVFLPT